MPPSLAPWSQVRWGDCDEHPDQGRPGRGRRHPHLHRGKSDHGDREEARSGHRDRRPGEARPAGLREPAHACRDDLVPWLGGRPRSVDLARDEDLARGGEAPARGRALGHEARVPRDDQDRDDDLQRHVLPHGPGREGREGDGAAGLPLGRDRGPQRSGEGREATSGRRGREPSDRGVEDGANHARVRTARDLHGLEGLPSPDPGTRGQEGILDPSPPVRDETGG